MHTMSRRRKNNIIIACLCGLLALMGVGYAVFNAQLKINGTSSISSEWNIRITNIETMLPSEMGAPIPDGYNISEPTYTAESATFNAGFETPGSEIYYVVEISNLGSIDGQVTVGNLSCGDNEAIWCGAQAMDVNPIEGNQPTKYFNLENGNQDYSDINFPLKSNEKHYILIGVGYEDVEEQPTDLDAEIKLDLTYEQYVDPNIPVPSGETTFVGNQEVDIVSGGDGLYADEYEEGRYVYKGANPNNYIKFANGEMWRIIAVENDGTYKIIKKDLLSEEVWDTSYSNNWARPATLNTYLNGEYLETLSDSDKVIPHTWDIGAVTSGNSDLNDQITDEKGTTWNGKIGLITVSEYLRANTNTEQCGTLSLNNDNNSTCKTTNWLFVNENYWTISADSFYSDYVWFVKKDGSLFRGSVTSIDYTYVGSIAPRPVVYLTSAITLEGSGTESDPFVIIN